MIRLNLMVAMRSNLGTGKPFDLICCGSVDIST